MSKGCDIEVSKYTKNTIKPFEHCIYISYSNKNVLVDLVKRNQKFSQKQGRMHYGFQCHSEATIKPGILGIDTDSSGDVRQWMIARYIYNNSLRCFCNFVFNYLDFRSISKIDLFIIVEIQQLIIGISYQIRENLRQYIQSYNIPVNNTLQHIYLLTHFYH